MSTSNPSSRYLYQPARAARVAMEEYDRRSKAPYSLTWGVPEVDEYIIPALPGDLNCFLGRPGHAKTTTLVHLCKRMSPKMPDGYLSVYATWETLIEELVAIYSSEKSNQSLEAIGRGTADMVRLADAIATGISDNVAVVGRSMERDERGNVADFQVHTLDDLEACLSYITSTGMKIGALFVDYLQRIPSGRRNVNRSEQVSEHLERIKDMALRFTCPSFVACQANREVDEGSGLLIPDLSSGQWASAIEQTADKLYGQTRPILYMEEGQQVILKKQGFVYEVNRRMMVYKVLKQRWGDSGKIFVLGMTPEMCYLETMQPTAMARDLF